MTNDRVDVTLNHSLIPGQGRGRNVGDDIHFQTGLHPLSNGDIAISHVIALLQLGDELVHCTLGLFLGALHRAILAVTLTGDGILG